MRRFFNQMFLCFWYVWAWIAVARAYSLDDTAEVLESCIVALASILFVLAFTFFVRQDQCQK